MCYVYQHRFACGDWKWGAFAHTCTDNHRKDETCGIKTPLAGQILEEKCWLCRKIDRRTKKRATTTNLITRWRKDGTHSSTVIQCAEDRIRNLDLEIHEFNRERQSRLTPVVVYQPTRNPCEESQSAKIVPALSVHIVLPIEIEGTNGSVSVMAVPDTGSDDNVISRELATSLGLTVKAKIPKDDHFRLPDGAIASCCGTVQAKCSFALAGKGEIKGYICTFRVLPFAISPLVMSFTFLQQTETMNRYRHRLRILPLSTSKTPRVRVIGVGRQRLHCLVDGEKVEAVVDTGADIDLLSFEYATSRSLKIERLEQEVMFADGRTKRVHGVVFAQLGVCELTELMHEHSVETSRESALLGDLHVQFLDRADPKSRNVVRSRFLVLDGLSTSVLIGAGSIETLKIFELHLDGLFMARVGRHAHPSFLRIGLRKAARRLVHEADNEMTDNSEPTPHARMNEADQRENAQREAADSKSARLTGTEKVAFDKKEQERRHQYEQVRAQLLHALHSP